MPAKGRVYTHWSRPICRMYEYNYQYGESYYKSQVQYIDRLKASTDKVGISRTRRAGTPPGARTFSERWAASPFYGRYTSSILARLQSEAITSSTLSASTSALASSTSTTAMASTAMTSAVAASSTLQSSQEMSSSSYSKMQKSAAERSSRYSNLMSSQEYSGSQQELDRTSAQMYSSRRTREASPSAYDWAMTQYDSKYGLRAVSEPPKNIRSTMAEANMNFSSSKSHLNEEVKKALNDPEYLESPYRTADSRLVYRAHTPVCDEKHGADHQRRFVLGDKYMDAAALGGFDLLYDPKNSNRRVQRIRQEIDTSEELSYYGRESSMDRSNFRARSVAVGGGYGY